jgi:hypothetical protein
VAVAVGVAAAVAWAGCGAASASREACLQHRPGDLRFTELMIDPAGADPGQEWLELHDPLDEAVDLAGFTLYRKSPDGTGLRSVPLDAGLVIAAGGYLVFGDPVAGPWVGSGAGARLAPLDNARGVVGLRCGEVILDEVTWTRPPSPGRSRMRSGDRWCDAPADRLYAPGNAGTPGAPNPACPDEVGGPTCLDGEAERPVRHPGPGEVLVTEVLASPAATRDAVGEWVEVLARADVDLNGVTVANATGGADLLDSRRCLAVRAGARALLARNADAFINGGLPTPLATFQVALSGQHERVQLRLGDAGLDEALLDPSTSGRAWQLDPAWLDSHGNDDPRHFCLAARPWRPDGGGDLGSPGAPDPPCPGLGPTPPPAPPPAPAPTGCLDLASGAQRPPRPPRRGQVALSEVMADPAAAPDATGEWIELRFAEAADLNGLTLRVSSGASSTLASEVCQTVSAGTHAVLARSRDRQLNGGLPLVSGAFGFSLRNDGDLLQLRGPDGGVLDELRWTSTRPGVSLQVHGGKACSTPDAGANHYGLGDLGTPGRPNPPCR